MPAFQSLVSSPAWAHLGKIAEAQANTRIAQILGPKEGLPKDTNAEFLKGEIAGMQTLLALPENIIDIMQAELANVTKEEKNETPIDE